MVDFDLNTPQETVDRFFGSQRRGWLKILGAGGVGLIVGIVTVRRLGLTSLAVAIGSVAVTTVSAMLAAALLMRMDAVQDRLQAGKPVSWPSRLLFGAGIWSLLIWIFLALLVGFPLAIIAGNLTFQRAAG